jgi:RimJ/RimL family protein N-acetyltransferase
VPAVRPLPRILEGRYVRVEPLERSHLDELWDAIGHPAVFAGGYGGGPAGLPADAAAFVEWGRTYYQWESGNVYGVRIASGADAGTLVGTSTLTDFELPIAATHIGWTAFDPRVWGTAVNPEAKLLMLGEAFDHGFGKVRLQADSVNARSRAAIEKLGAQFEGVLRRVRLRADGTLSGTAVYSVLDDEWPAVRAGLERRLDVFGGEPVRLAAPGVRR